MFLLVVKWVPNTSVSIVRYVPKQIRNICLTFMYIYIHIYAHAYNKNLLWETSRRCKLELEWKAQIKHLSVFIFRMNDQILRDKKKNLAIVHSFLSFARSWGFFHLVAPEVRRKFQSEGLRWIKPRNIQTTKLCLVSYLLVLLVNKLLKHGVDGPMNSDFIGSLPTRE